MGHGCSWFFLWLQSSTATSTSCFLRDLCNRGPRPLAFLALWLLSGSSVSVAVRSFLLHDSFYSALIGMTRTASDNYCMTLYGMNDRAARDGCGTSLCPRPRCVRKMSPFPHIFINARLFIYLPERATIRDAKYRGKNSVYNVARTKVPAALNTKHIRCRIFTDCNSIKMKNKRDRSTMLLA